MQNLCKETRLSLNLGCCGVNSWRGSEPGRVTPAKRDLTEEQWSSYQTSPSLCVWVFYARKFFEPFVITQFLLLLLSLAESSALTVFLHRMTAKISP